MLLHRFDGIHVNDQIVDVHNGTLDLYTKIFVGLAYEKSLVLYMLLQLTLFLQVEESSFYCFFQNYT